MAEKIKLIDGKLIVPENPVIPFIEGDGTGSDIWKASVRVFDAAVRSLTTGKGKLPGRRYWPVKKPLNKPGTGCLKRL